MEHRLIVVACQDELLGDSPDFTEFISVMSSDCFPRGSDSVSELRSQVYRIVTGAYPLCLRLSEAFLGNAREVMFDRSAVGTSAALDEAETDSWIGERGAVRKQRDFFESDTLNYISNCHPQKYVLAIVPQSFYQRVSKNEQPPPHKLFPYPKPQAELPQIAAVSPKPQAEPPQKVAVNPIPQAEPPQIAAVSPKPQAEPPQKVVTSPKPQAEPSQKVAVNPKPQAEPPQIAAVSPKPQAEPPQTAAVSPKPQAEPSQKVVFNLAKTKTPKYFEDVAIARLVVSLRREISSMPPPLSPEHFADKFLSFLSQTVSSAVESVKLNEVKLPEEDFAEKTEEIRQEAAKVSENYQQIASLLGDLSRGVAALG